MIIKNMTEFNFEISLSVLDHLGRNLYRSFITVIGEAISNSWDADAENVWIYIDLNNNNFVIKDDGIGMSENDFQKKFLKIGYTKRKNDISTSTKGRPYIGRKGIGKLALLSCAEKISIKTKTNSTDYIGGVIDNSGLDDAIDNDVTAQDYTLEKITDDDMFSNYMDEHKQGTIIYFENINDGIRNKLQYIKELTATYFRFSLIDKSFNIFVNDEKITEIQLESLANNTQFLWKINELEDVYISTLKKLKKQKTLDSSLPVKGFIASVDKPSSLKIRTADEKVGIDLFVNGRLREKNILSHFSDFSTRVVASYLYGQIHFNKLDDGSGDDRFTSNREGVKEGDAVYKKLLEELKDILENISKQWDEWRVGNKEDGDIENTRLTRKERKAKSLVNEVSSEFSLPETSLNKNEVDGWIDNLHSDAQFNVTAYIDCFMSENLIRRYIDHKGISLTCKATEKVKKWRANQHADKNKGNISIDVIEGDNDLDYLSMDSLADLVDNSRSDHTKSSLSRDAMEYKPMRNAMAHTARLTTPAKQKLTSVYENIKGRLKNLLSQ